VFSKTTNYFCRYFLITLGIYGNIQKIITIWPQPPNCHLSISSNGTRVLRMRIFSTVHASQAMTMTCPSLYIIPVPLMPPSTIRWLSLNMFSSFPPFLLHPLACPLSFGDWLPELARLLFQWKTFSLPGCCCFCFSVFYFFSAEQVAFL